MSKKNIKNLGKITKGYFNVPIEGNDEANEVWKILFERNIDDLKLSAHSLFNKGIRELSIAKHSVPSAKELNKKINLKVGWKITSTDDEYSNADEWFKHLSQKSFLVTKVIRSKENLDYTPFPEAFHDIFGHIPFMHSKRYMRLIHKFGKKFQELKVKKQKQEFINFWWYTIEFGLIKEKGKIKVLGAGLMSSFGERRNAFSSNVIIKHFNVNEMKRTSISDHEFHKKLFVADSLDQIEDVVDKWK